MISRLRHQLAVHSPIPAAALLRAAPAVAGRAARAEAELRTRLRERYRADDVVLCASGTQALQLALVAAARRTDGEGIVALPAFACYDVAAAAVGAGLRIALYDLEPDTLSPAPASLERTLAAGARVAVIAPLYGMPVDWDALADIAGRAGAVLVEDAAQGHGAAWNGRPLGSLGPISILSFGRGKGWTGGAGGAVLVREDTAGLREALAPAAPLDGARCLAAAAAQWGLGRPAVYGLPAALPWLALGETVYHEPVPPRTMSAAAVALARASRAAADREAEARRRNARTLLDGLREATRAVRPIEPLPGAEPGYLRLPVRADSAERLLRSAPALRRMGVARSYPTTLAALPATRARLTGPERRWPGAERLAAELLTLPTHTRASDTDRALLLHALRHLAP